MLAQLKFGSVFAYAGVLRVLIDARFGPSKRRAIDLRGRLRDGVDVVRGHWCCFSLAAMLPPRSTVYVAAQLAASIATPQSTIVLRCLHRGFERPFLDAAARRGSTSATHVVGGKMKVAVIENR